MRVATTIKTLLLISVDEYSFHCVQPTVAPVRKLFP